ncbi:MAG: L-seryl-tRNA(Sec) selenium transferase [Gemmatimonadota bacterium]
MTDPRSRIPGVDALLQSEPVVALVDQYGHLRTVDALRAAIEEVRGLISAASEGPERAEWEAVVEDAEMYADAVRDRLEAADRPSLRHVVNATGVVLHTNLGRAPLAAEAVHAMQRVAGSYSNLEFDLNEGVRGSRYVHCVSLLTELTGAEDALVVNNAAGALVLALNTLAVGRGVAVSRGELVEIGGGFRIPEVLERAGARLVEVGSTNRTRLADYEEAVEASAPHALLKVHRSNFRITGFTEEASVAELVELGRRADVPLVHDLGSGLMVDPSRLGLPAEPTAADSLAAGADVVVVSGDKLMGATQAGVIVGRADLMARMRKNPLCRALRVDKVTLAGLEATLQLYRDPETAISRIPTLSMLAAGADGLRSRADRLAEAARELGIEVGVVPSGGAVGGGTFPGVELEGWALRVDPPQGAPRFTRTLRDAARPVVGRIVDDAVLFDVRTVMDGDEGALLEGLASAWKGGDDVG